MENRKLTKTLSQLIDRILEGGRSPEKPLTVNDLRLQIRTERLTEASHWSDEELDLMEVHAAQFDSAKPAVEVLAISDSIRMACHSPERVSKICAPSPFAWT